MNAMAELSNLHALRLCASLIATGAALLLCVNLHHFTPSLLDPSSFLLATHHRCGWTLILATTWALLESSTYLALSKSFAGRI